MQEDPEKKLIKIKTRLRAGVSLLTLGYMYHWYPQVGDAIDRHHTLTLEAVVDSTFTVIKPLLLLALGNIAIAISSDLRRKIQTSRGTYLRKNKKIPLYTPPKSKSFTTPLTPAAYLHSVKAFIYRLLSMDNQLEAELEKILQYAPSNLQTWILKDDLYKRQGRRNERFLHLRKFLRLYRKLGGITFDSVTAELIQQRADQPLFHHSDTDDCLSRAFYARLTRDPEETVYYIKEALSTSQNLEHRLLAAEILEEVLDVQKEVRPEWYDLQKQFWSETTEQIPLEEMCQISESKNKVYRIRSNAALEEMFVIKEGTRTDITSERETTETLRAIVEAYEGYFVSKPVSQIDQEKASYLVIKRELGKNLYDLIREGDDYRHFFPPIIDILAIIHATFPLDKAGPQEDLQETAFTKIKTLETDEATKINLREGYLPVVFFLNATPFVFNKDAHPENWRIGDNGLIGVLDCERTRRIPQSCDLANLMDYGTYLPDKDKNSLLDRYANRFNKHATIRIQDTKDFKMRYYHAVIHRAIALSAAMQHRTTRQTTRTQIHENARNAFSKIREEEPELYTSYEKYYIKLNRGLQRLIP